MRETALVIMAAGLGSRYGGVKQLEPVGPSGEIIMDYSIYDAIEAGFNKIVFIIRKDIEEDFMEVIGHRIEKFIKVEYVIQDVKDLPNGYQCPENRTKPWGTGHAILSCKGKVQEPVAVINADDYDGKEAFRLLHDELVTVREEEDHKYSMAGFVLKNTLSENGGVTRGICKVDEYNQLTQVYETKNIVSKGEYAVGDSILGKGIQLDLDSIVSMNMWGFTPDIMEDLEHMFRSFLDEKMHEDLKAEFLLPDIVGSMLEKDACRVHVLRSNDNWFGVTYKEDKEFVVKSFHKLVEQGVYPVKLFG